MSALTAPFTDDGLVIATFNHERNGNGEPSLRRAAYDVLSCVHREVAGHGPGVIPCLGARAGRVRQSVV